MTVMIGALSLILRSGSEVFRRLSRMELRNIVYVFMRVYGGATGLMLNMNTVSITKLQY